MTRSTLPAHLANLLEAQFYDHPVTAIQVIETHISWVILTGQFAYKVKKNVKLPFLDFSSLVSRKHFCEEELRLNKRFAPDIYLSIVAITKHNDTLALNGSGEVIEYAVKMRQFDSQRQLNQLVANDLISLAQIVTLADDLARIHDSLPSAPLNSTFGEISAISDAALENFSTLATLITDQQDLADLAILKQWTNQFCDNNSALFSDRKLNGFIRECHGDLHLGNITLINDNPVIFDCIEFNDDFRWIDIINDLAFLVMDLHFHHRPELAQRLLNHYLELTGDYQGLRLMPFYLVYRAMVRCKVAAITAHQRNAMHSTKEYQSYLALAVSFTHTINPHLLITHGLSGSGKSIVSQMLVDSSKTIRVRSDVERKRLFGMSALAQSSDEEKSVMYSTAATAQTYARLEQCARDIISANYHVIVDATFLKAEPRQRFRMLASQLGVEFVIISTTAPLALLKQWICERQQSGRDASEATLEVLESQIISQDLLSDEEKKRCITLSTDKTFEKIDILSAIESTFLTFHGNES